MHASPYQLVLRDTFHQLAPILQQIHGGVERRTATGTFLVERGSSRLARLMAALMRLPRESPHTEIRLLVEAQGKHERWRRWFGKQAVTTWQRAAGETLRESSPPFAMYFSLQVAEGGMTMHSGRVTLLGIPLPRLISPRIIATEFPSAGGWQVEVEIRLPVVGRVIRYSGTMAIP